MNNRFGIAFIIIICFFITACGQAGVSEEIHQHLEETVQIEKEFETNQEKIFVLEQEDEEIYNEIIALGSEDVEKVKELSDQAIDLLEERLKYIDLEKTSLEESKVEFEKIGPLMEDIDDEDQKEQIEKMYETMMNRYEAYDDVFDTYSESINLTKELYELLQSEELKENEVYSIIANVNDSYDEVLEANEQFNKETVLYNNFKKEYYEQYVED